MTKAPSRVPRMLPRPPVSAAPPMTTAAMAVSSYVVPAVGSRRSELGGQDEARDRRADAGQHVDGDLYSLHRHARQFRRALVAAGSVEPSAERRAGQHEAAENRDDHHDDDADRHTEQVIEAEPVEPGVAEFRPAAEIVVGQAVGHQQGDAAHHVHDAQGRDEGRHLEARDQNAVDEADEGAQRAGQHRHHPDRGEHHDAEGAQRHALHQGTRDDPRKSERGADRQVDAAVEDDEQHADGEDREQGDVRRHRQEVAAREVVGR